MGPLRLPENRHRRERWFERSSSRGSINAETNGVYPIFDEIRICAVAKEDGARLARVFLTRPREDRLSVGHESSSGIGREPEVLVYRPVYETRTDRGHRRLESPWTRNRRRAKGERASGPRKIDVIADSTRVVGRVRVVRRENAYATDTACSRTKLEFLPQNVQSLNASEGTRSASFQYFCCNSRRPL